MPRSDFCRLLLCHATKIISFSLLIMSPSALLISYIRKTSRYISWWPRSKGGFIGRNASRAQVKPRQAIGGAWHEAPALSILSLYAEGGDGHSLADIGLKNDIINTLSETAKTITGREIMSRAVIKLCNVRQISSPYLAGVKVITAFINSISHRPLVRYQENHMTFKVKHRPTAMPPSVLWTLSLRKKCKPEART